MSFRSFLYPSKFERTLDIMSAGRSSIYPKGKPDIPSVVLEKAKLEKENICKHRIKTVLDYIG